MVLCAFIGFTSACLGPLLPDILERISGTENLAVAYGMIYVLEAAGSVLGPPFAGTYYLLNGAFCTASKYCSTAGLLKDTYATYEYSFYLAGVAMLLSGGAALWPLKVRQLTDGFEKAYAVQDGEDKEDDVGVAADA